MSGFVTPGAGAHVAINHGQEPSTNRAGNNSIYQIDFTTVACGKRISSSKRRIRWRFGFTNMEALENGETGTACRGEEHDITLVWSVTSGRRLVLTDGQEVHYSNARNTIFEFSWTMRGNHVLKIIAHAAVPINPLPGFRQYDFLVNGRSFFIFPRVYRLGLNSKDARNVVDNSGPPAIADRGQPYTRESPVISSGNAVTALEVPHNEEEERMYLEEAIKNSLAESGGVSAGGFNTIDTSQSLGSEDFRAESYQQSAPGGDDLLLDIFGDVGTVPNTNSENAAYAGAQNPTVESAVASSSPAYNQQQQYLNYNTGNAGQPSDDPFSQNYLQTPVNNAPQLPNSMSNSIVQQPPAQSHPQQNDPFSRSVPPAAALAPNVASDPFSNNAAQPNPQTATQPTAGNPFGSNVAPRAGDHFGNNAAHPFSNNAVQPAAAGPLGNNAQLTSGSPFGNNAAQGTASNPNGYNAAQTSATDQFVNNVAAQPAPNALGNNTAQPAPAVTFNNNAAQPAPADIFGNNASQLAPADAFGNNAAQATVTDLYGNNAAAQTTAVDPLGGLFSSLSNKGTMADQALGKLMSGFTLADENDNLMQANPFDENKAVGPKPTLAGMKTVKPPKHEVMKAPDSMVVAGNQQGNWGYGQGAGMNQHGYGGQMQQQQQQQPMINNMQQQQQPMVNNMYGGYPAQQQANYGAYNAGQMGQSGPGGQMQQQHGNPQQAFYGNTSQQQGNAQHQAYYGQQQNFQQQQQMQQNTNQQGQYQK